MTLRFDHKKSLSKILLKPYIVVPTGIFYVK